MQDQQRPFFENTKYCQVTYWNSKIHLKSSKNNNGITHKIEYWIFGIEKKTIRKSLENGFKFK